LFVTLGLASLLILFMYYYLNLMRAQNVAVARSQAWNGAMAAAEAGVEEALAHLNPGAVPPVIDRSADGWGLPVDGFYGPQTRTLDGGSRYSVIFSAWAPLTIISTGSVTVAAISATLTRVVQVVATNVPLFTTAMATKYGITMNGSGISTDSFDSSNPNLSTNGQYDSDKTSTNGDVASVYGPVNPGNHTIKGDLYLGSTATYSGNSGSYTGKKHTDFNVDFADVVLPVTTWQTPPGSQTINGRTYDHAFVSTSSSGDYLIPDSGSIYVGTNVNVRLKVTATTFSPDAIKIAGSPTNSGKLTIYMTGTTLNIDSSDTFNQGGIAGNLNYYGTPSNTTISLNGNAKFIGAIYAPSADLTIGGGGNNPQDFMGSSITRSATFNGHFKFHFDESLLKTGDSRGYVVTTWTEL
jgi:hypothetical protein